MATEIRNISRLEVKVNSDNEDTFIQWGVEDKRTGRIVRGASTREIARRFAARSRFYRVVRRELYPTFWETEKI